MESISGQLEGFIGELERNLASNTLNTEAARAIESTLGQVNDYTGRVDELRNLARHDLSNILDVPRALAWSAREGNIIPEWQLRESLGHIIGILWSMILAITPETETSAIFEKTRKTMLLSEYLDRYLRLIYGPITSHRLSGATGASEVDTIKKEIIAAAVNGDDPQIILESPGDMANFMRNAVSNAKKRGKATDVVLRYSHGFLSILDDGKGIDESSFPDANDVFINGTSGAGSTGIGFRDLGKRRISANAQHHGGLPSHTHLNLPGNSGAAIHISLLT